MLRLGLVAVRIVIELLARVGRPGLAASPVEAEVLAFLVAVVALVPAEVNLCRHVDVCELHRSSAVHLQRPKSVSEVRLSLSAHL